MRVLNKIFYKIRESVFIHELGHLFLSLSFGLFYSLLFGDLSLLFVSLLGGFFIDVDHMIDFLYFVTKEISKNSNNYRLSDFFRPSWYIRKTGKVFVILHGWEYVLILFYLSFGKEQFFYMTVFVFSLSYFFHMLYDQITSAGTLLSYFFLYRLFKRFNLKAFDGQ